jgi:hypothetical protein
MDWNETEVLGTTEPPPARHALTAGPLSVLLEDGQLRSLRWHGIEVVRGIAWLVRDAAWGTLPATLSDPAVEEAGGAFAVRYGGRAGGDGGRIAFHARIEGDASGRLSFEVTARAGTDFVTNRTGFVVLHPDDAAGLPLRVDHADGSVEETAFPVRISPDQPAFDIVAMEHAPAPGLSVRVAFEGGVWEMEDQRNWADASYKTYVRPLAWPRPYVIPAGSEETQRVVVRLSGRPQESAVPARAAKAAGEGRVPPLHLRLAEGLPVPEALPLGGLAKGLIVRLRTGAPEPGPIGAAAALARREGLALLVEALCPQRDPTADARACLEAIAGHGVETLLVAAERDLRTRPSGDLPEGEAPLGDMVAALRAAGFGGRIGAGVPSFFTEFNRNPPPPDADFAFFGVCPIVHAADDVSVMETLRVLPVIMESAQALLPGVGLWPGPLSLAPTVNPYGPGLVETDGTTRTCLAARDPRHGALFGAAHLVGALAGVAAASEAVAPLLANGPSGVAGADGAPLPLAFVLAEVAAAEGARRVPGPTGPGLASLAWEREGTATILVASTTPEAQEVAMPPGTGAVDALAPGARGWQPVAAPGGTLRLGGYGTLRIRLRG